MTDLRSLQVQREGHVAEVVLVGPGKGNAMGPDFWKETPAVFRELDGDPSVRAIVVRGSGEHFTFGLDLMAMAPSFGAFLAATPTAEERLRLLATVFEMQSAFNAMADCRKPVIAAVQGWCIGGGVDLITACDIRVCAANAKFSVREVKVAMVADLGTLQRLPHVVGEGHARELALTGKNIDATRAKSIGLVNDVYDDEAAMLAAARGLAQEIASNSPLVVRGIKEVMNDRVRGEVNEGLRRVALWNSAFLPSPDLGEALMAFGERRPPKY